MFEHEIYRKSAKEHVSHITAGETGLAQLECEVMRPWGNVLALSALWSHFTERLQKIWA